jgi:hypothetical protein
MPIFLIKVYLLYLVGLYPALWAQGYSRPCPKASRMPICGGWAFLGSVA